MEGLKEKIGEFSAFVTLQQGLLRSTRDNYSRIMSKILRDIGSLAPTHTQFKSHMLSIMDSEFSYSHKANCMRAIEQYTSFMEEPLEFKRQRKPKPTLGEMLTEAEVTLILASCKNIREKAVLSLLAYSGIRCNELCSAKVGDADLRENCLRVRGKAKKDSVSFFPGDCSKILQQYLADFPRPQDSFLFTSLRHNDQLSTWAIRKMVRKVASRSPVTKRVHPHLFRHSLASNMLDRGANPVTIQGQLRHAHLSTTMLYVHSRKERIKAEYECFRPKYT